MKPTATIHGGQDAAPTESRATDKHKFGRMFPQYLGQEMLLKLETCRVIGDQMTSRVEEARKDSNIPAGYTYFGQFVDHDLSMDATTADPASGDADGAVNQTPDELLIQKRSPSLDLDNLYSERSDLNESLFLGPRFKIGKTSAVQSNDDQTPVDRNLPYDLPRVSSSNPQRPAGKALIGDPRNDENLAVAQTHLMWLKFHNHIVDQLEKNAPSISDDALFATAKELVVKHYQFVVLNDFARRFIREDIYTSVIVDGKRRYLQHGSGEIPFMPLEFSVAAYRHGHSQVRETYDWNLLFPGVSFKLLFLFSEVSGGPNALNGHSTLPTNWIADFRRLYDFGDVTFDHIRDAENGSLNFAKSLDPYLASPLGDLPELQGAVASGKLPFSNLASLNLRRGSLRGLLSGQDIARSISTVKTLTPTEMRSVLDDDFVEQMEALQLFDRTPLWLYLLLEAAVEGGNSLGELGSIIVAETFQTMVLTSGISILKSGAKWSPIDTQEELGALAPLETIPDILLWMDERDPIIDPLRDVRI